MRSGRLGAMIGAIAMMFSSGASVRTPAPKAEAPVVSNGRTKFRPSGKNKPALDRAKRDRRNRIARQSRRVNRWVAAHA